MIAVEKDIFVKTHLHTSPIVVKIDARFLRMNFTRRTCAAFVFHVYYTPFMFRAKIHCLQIVLILPIFGAIFISSCCDDSRLVSCRTVGFN